MIKDNEYELYELVLKDEEDSVFALSLVSEPAIMQDFIFFNAEGKQVIKFATANEDKHLIVGPILIPDIKILRLKEDGVTPYYVTFTKETVEKIAQKYIKDNNANNITLEHMKSVNNVSLVESWIVESSVYDKSKAYGLTVKPGTWMGVFSLENNKELWNDYVKTGLVKGISLEGLFTHELIKASKVKFDILEKDIEELTEEEAVIVLSKIKQMFESYSDYGQEISNNAKRGIELNEANGNKCATQVGKVRAQQLANGEPISVETIKRMYSYLSRAEVYYDETDTKACGTISYLLWGGKSALSYSRNKLKELGLLQENEAQPSITSTYPGQAASGSIAPALLSEEGNINVFGIETEYFYMCPGAVELFTHLTSMEMDEDTKGMVRSAALQADRVFDIEEDVLEDGLATPKDLGEAIVLVSDFKDLMKEIDDITGMKHDVSFMDGHIQIIKKYI